MKKLTRAIISTMLLILCFTLTACDNKYSSHYSASTMASKNTSSEASVSFGSFSGVYVIKLKSSGNDQVFITYNATLKKGNIKVYYDYDDEKLDLFTIGADGSVSERTEAFTTNQTIYIIIESDGKCNEGSFSFALKKS